MHNRVKNNEVANTRDFHQAGSSVKVRRFPFSSELASQEPNSQEEAL